MGTPEDVGGLQTLPVDDATRSALADELPSRWEQYELLGMLGKGGMGSVYKARDHRLGRTVAIKFVHGADPNLTVRLLHEARAQARIDHPNVCKVYHIDEIQQRPYIVFQLIEGTSLQAVAAEMSLADKVTVMRDVALAMQAVHGLDIVHRDIKPANIMVKRGDDKRWIPVVMDFGLARESTVDPGLTLSGTPVGTPAYMSPEQARGDGDAIDRRSDVYGLGATLYELLVGRPPFVEATWHAVVDQVLRGEPAAPRALVPALPRDVETIALKAMAKEPGQRYASARALAEDLDRYLDGEPVLGRRASPWQRLRRRVRRHRAVVVLGAIAIAAIAAVGAFAVRTWLLAQVERLRGEQLTALAQELERDTQDIEYTLREAYLLPLHDTRRDREIVRAKMAAITRRPAGLGDRGSAVVHDAMGRGYLALHQWRDAAGELKLAIEGGRERPELHAALGRALGEQYRALLDKVRRSPDKAWVARRERELESQYLSPAIDELVKSRHGAASAALLEARIALYRRDFAGAEQQALALTGETRMLYEAHKIAGDAAYGAGLEAADRGDYEVGRAAFDRAVALYSQASDAARSDASLYKANAQAWLQRVELDLRQGNSGDGPFEQALAAIDRALRAEPEDGATLVTKAYLLLRWTRISSAKAELRSRFERAEQAARQAIEIDRADADAWDAVGNVHIARGVQEPVRRESDAWLRRAEEEIGTALRIQPDHLWANNDIGAVHRWLGANAAGAGEDPLPEYRLALDHYKTASKLDPQYLYACTNQVDIFAEMSDYELVSGRSPEAAAAAAIRAGDSCLLLDANYYSTLNTLAQAQLAVAHFLVATGADPTRPLASTRQYLDQAERINREHHVTLYHRGVTERTEAEFRLQRLTSPLQPIAEARGHLHRALNKRRSFMACYVELARLDLVEAAWVAHAGASAGALLASARASIDKVVSTGEGSVDANMTAARVYLQLALAHRSGELARRGGDYADRALKLRPQLPGGEATRAALAALARPR